MDRYSSTLLAIGLALCAFLLWLEGQAWAECLGSFSAMTCLRLLGG